MLFDEEESAPSKVDGRTKPLFPSRAAPGAAASAETLHVLTCGSVDDGKSTLIGRLLWDAGDLPEDTRAAILKTRKPDGQPDLSLLVDGLVAEREQGITIDIAWRYVDTIQGRRFVIIDSPGHEQYTRNMASGASHASVAILLADARSGIKIQTRRHLALLDLCGVKRVILCVNKMDLVNWSAAAFASIEADFRALLAPFHFEHAAAIPIAAKHGDNVARRRDAISWYNGRTLLGELNAIPVSEANGDGTFRMPVQLVLRHEDFRGLAGTIASGSVAPGDVVRDIVSGQLGKVVRIVTMDGDLTKAGPGQAVALQLDTDADISRGAFLTSADAAMQAATLVEADLVWLADSAFNASDGVLLRTATDLVPVERLEIINKLNLETLERMQAFGCGANDIVRVRVALARPVALDRFTANRETGSFVLVDALTGNTIAGGAVAEAQAKSPRAPSAFKLTQERLARGVCRGLDPMSAEFKRRAREVAAILSEAGITVALT